MKRNAMPSPGGRTALLAPQLLARSFFALACLAAAALVGLVLFSPWLARGSPVLALFARDATLRRTALASAAGLAATACIFFRSPAPPRSSRPPRRPPPAVAGA